MSAKALLEELRGRDVELMTDGDRLRYRPKSAVTPDLLDRLRRHKPSLLRLLEREKCKAGPAGRLG